MPDLIINDLNIMALYNKHVIVSVVKVWNVIRGPPSNHQGGGGGVFVADKLFIFCINIFY